MGVRARACARPLPHGLSFMFPLVLGLAIAFGSFALEAAPVPTAHAVELFPNGAGIDAGSLETSDDDGDASSATGTDGTADENDWMHGTDSSSATSVEIADLTGVDPALDGTRVTFSGEVVSEALRSGDPGHRWVNVNTGNDTIGVYVTAEDADKVGYSGGYGVRGATVTVTGTYHTACPEHDGELDVHAESFEIRDPGGPTDEGTPSPRAWMLGIVLVGAGLLVNLIASQLHRRGRI